MMPERRMAPRTTHVAPALAAAVPATRAAAAVGESMGAAKGPGAAGRCQSAKRVWGRAIDRRRVRATVPPPGGTTWNGVPRRTVILGIDNAKRGLHSYESCRFPPRGAAARLAQAVDGFVAVAAPD